MQHGVVRHQRQVNVLRLTTHVVHCDFKKKNKVPSQHLLYFTARCTDMGQDGVWSFCHVLWIQGCVKFANGDVASNLSDQNETNSVLEQQH